MAEKPSGALASRLPATHPLVALLVGGLLVALITLTSLVAPEAWRGAANLAVGTAFFLVAFIRLPKPTLLVFAVFVLFYETLDRWLGPGIGQIDEAVIPGLVLIAAWRIRPWRRRLIEPLRDGAVVTVVVLAVLASLVNGVPVAVWPVALLLLVKGIAFLYVVMWHEFTAADVRQFTVAVLAVGVVVLALGGVELVIGPGFREALNLGANVDVRGQLPGLTSIFRFPVLFSWFAAFVSLFLFAYYVVYRRLWLLVGAVLFGVGVFLAGRRRAIIGVAVALAGGILAQLKLGISRRSMLRLWAPVAVVTLVLVVVFWPGLVQLADQTWREFTRVEVIVPEPTEDRPDEVDEFVQANPRLVLYITSVTIATDYFPLGAGLGRYGSPMSRVDFSPLYAEYGLDRIWGLTPLFRAYVTDTFWPHVLGEIGVFGLIAYLVFIAMLAISLWRATREVTEPYLHAFCLAAWMVFLHALVESLASSMYESPPRAYLLFGTVGVALALLRAARRARREGESASAVGRAAPGPAKPPRTRPSSSCARSSGSACTCSCRVPGWRSTSASAQPAASRRIP